MVKAHAENLRIPKSFAQCQTEADAGLSVHLAMPNVDWSAGTKIYIILKHFNSSIISFKNVVIILYKMATTVENGKKLVGSIQLLNTIR